MKFLLILASILILSVIGMQESFAGFYDNEKGYFKVENIRGEIVSVFYYSIHDLMDRGYLKEMPECYECPRCGPVGGHALCEACNIGMCEASDYN